MPTVDDKNELLKTTLENVSFEDDPEKFCKQIYDEARERNEQLESVNIENLDFYEGRDSLLDDRADDRKVVRSSLFVHELTPGIDTRIGRMIAKLEEREEPVTFRSRQVGVPKEVQDDVAFTQTVINQQLRDCGYLTSVFQEQALGGEIFRTPSTVKVGWMTYTEDVPIPVHYSAGSKLRAFLSGRAVPQDHIRWEKRTGGKPYAQWLPTHEFLYQPGVSVFEDDSIYAIHAPYMDKREVMAYAMEHDCDLKAVEEFFDEENSGEGGGESVATVKDATEANRDTPLQKDEREGKYLVTENYILTRDEMGEEQMWLTVMLGNRKLIKNSPYDLKGMKYPFVPLVINRLPGRLENLSSIDKCKEMQRLYNEAINSYLDGMTYRIFPPFKLTAGSTFTEVPVYGPGEIWYLSNPEELSPVIENPGQLPNLPALIESIGAKIRDTLNAHDMSRGFQSQQYEKATSSSLRASGEQKRAMPVHKVYGEVIIKVAEMFLALNRQFHPESYRFANDMVIDVPSLTNVTDPETDKQEAMLLLAQMGQDQLYQGPEGLQKRRNAWENVIRKMNKVDVDNLVLSEQDVDNMIKRNLQMQLAQVQKQAVIEDISMASGGGK